MDVDIDWREALEKVVAESRHQSYRDYCADGHPNRDLWRRRMILKAGGSVPGHGPAPARPRGLSDRPRGLARELVVCRYNEDLDWLDAVPADFFVTIADKSALPFRVTRPFRLQYRRNVGREAHSMVAHIVEHYGDLAEWTYFVQGDAPFHSPDIIGRLGVEYADLCSLTETYSDIHPPSETHAHDRVEYHGGYRVAYGNAKAPCPRPFGSDGAEIEPFWNPAAWSHWCAVPEPEAPYFGYAAMYAVPRRRIVARPLAFWQFLLGELTAAPSQRDGWFPDHPITAWKAEAMWLYWLADPNEYPHRLDRVIRRPAIAVPTETSLLSVAESIGRIRRIKACPFWSKAECRCSGGKCGLKNGKTVSYQDCFICMENYP